MRVAIIQNLTHAGLQPQNDVLYSDKIFRCTGDESSLEECRNMELSGICCHVKLSCNNSSESPDYTPPPPHTHTQGNYSIFILYITAPLSPIEVCVPTENANEFEAVSKLFYILLETL